MSEVDVEVDIENDEALLLNSEKVKTKNPKNSNLILKSIILILSLTIVILVSCFGYLQYSNTNKEIECPTIQDDKDNNINKEVIENKINNPTNTDSTLEILKPEGFEWVDPKNTKGPITINKKEDDGTKLDYYDFIQPEDDSFYYDKKAFDKLEQVINPDKSLYLCEFGTGSPPEAYQGYTITCPRYYTISIDNAFYGRHAHDKENCNRYYEGRPVEDEMLEVEEECGSHPIENVKELCEGKLSCTLRPGGSHFTDSCPGKFKYLHVSYHCMKDKEFKKERISVVMFSNIIKPNSIYENAISAFYQYSQIHGYEFQFNSYRYDTERQVFYMKLNSILEKIIIGLKEKKYDWVFWVDSDVILANPNIKLEAFLPNDKMNNIHLIVADDVNGLNAGVFLIRVHPWSLNFLMRAMSYSYFHNQLGEGLKYADQSSMNNVLVEGKEEDHYVIVPQNWFNSYIGLNEDGDFLLHLAGHVKKDDEAKTFREHITKDDKWYKKSSKEMRKEVLKYYDLPKNKQHHIKKE